MNSLKLHSKDLLTIDECLTIVCNDLRLANSDNLILRDYKLCKVNELFGFAGNYHSLQITIEFKDKPNTFKTFHYFVKSASTHYVKILEKELTMYRSILPNIQRYAKWPLYPRCLLNRSDIMVLEHLSQQSQHNLLMLHYDSSPDYTPQSIELFLEHLAEMHAASLEWLEKENIDILHNPKYDITEKLMGRTNKWYLVSIKATQYIARHDPEFQYDSALEFIDNRLYDVMENIGDHLHPVRDQLNVFCHRDCWPQNIFYGCDPVTKESKCCRLVDFQLSRFGSPANDVLFFLYNSLSYNEWRTTHSQNQSLKRKTQFSKTVMKYLQFYYEQFSNNLQQRFGDSWNKDSFTLNCFLKDCRRALLPILVAKTVCETLMKLPKEWTRSIQSEQPEAYHHFMNIDRTDMIRRMSLEDNAYLISIRQPITELMAYFGYMALGERRNHSIIHC